MLQATAWMNSESIMLPEGSHRKGLHVAFSSPGGAEARVVAA